MFPKWKSKNLEWTTDHPGSSYGIGVILFKKSSDGNMLDGENFSRFVHELKAWIEVDSEETRKKVNGALVTAATGLQASIIVKND